MFRLTPSPFLREETLQEIGNIYRDHHEVAAVAVPLGIPVAVVAENWRAIEQHKWLLSERLGRDVGSQVAALDYFENISKTISAHPPSWIGKLVGSVLANLDGDGPQSIANLERIMNPKVRGN
jgi:hypothetical protein